jgi:hypothetical protein
LGRNLTRHPQVLALLAAEGFPALKHPSVVGWPGSARGGSGEGSSAGSGAGSGGGRGKKGPKPKRVRCTLVRPGALGGFVPAAKLPTAPVRANPTAASVRRASDRLPSRPSLPTPRPASEGAPVTAARGQSKGGGDDSGDDGDDAGAAALAAALNGDEDGDEDGEDRRAAVVLGRSSDGDDGDDDADRRARDGGRSGVGGGGSGGVWGSLGRALSFGSMGRGAASPQPIWALSWDVDSAFKGTHSPRLCSLQCAKLMISPNPFLTRSGLEFRARPSCQRGLPSFSCHPCARGSIPSRRQRHMYLCTAATSGLRARHGAAAVGASVAARGRRRAARVRLARVR